MKKLLLLALVIANCQLLTVNCFAQAPKKMNYQGVVRDANGQTLVNKTVNLRLSILSAEDINNPTYAEEQTVTTNAFGLFAIKIGEGNAIVGEMNDIDWSSADHFVSIELDADNNGHFQFMGTSQLLSVPYAFYAETAGKAIDIENADQYRDIPFSGTSGQTIRSNGQEWEASSTLFNISSKIGIGTTAPSEKLDVNGSINLSQGNEIKIGGERALKLDVNRNMMQGEQAGNALTSGVNNNFIGNRAGRVNTTGSNNSFIGYRAGLRNTTGDGNMFLGYRAGHFNTTGSNNFYGGLNAGYNSTTGLNNIALGTNAGFNLGDGKDNTLVGRDAGFNTTGNRNAFIGTDAGKSNTTGFDNTYIGYNASGNATLENATAIGANASVTANNSVVLGNAANVGVGTSAPADKLHLVGDMRLDGGRIDVRNTGGSVIIGEKAGLVDDFSTNRNVFIGYESGETNISGKENAAIGPHSLSKNTSGNHNTALGRSASGRNTTGDENVAVGRFALYENETGDNNTAIGANALDWGGNADANNTALGYEAGYNIEGSSNVFLGYRAGKAKSGSNQLFIENSAADKNNALIYGEFDNDILALNANVGIGTSSPEDKLHVAGNIRMVDGNQAAGYVMTSDANGTATWQPLQSLDATNGIYTPCELALFLDIDNSANTPPSELVTTAIWQEVIPTSDVDLGGIAIFFSSSGFPGGTLNIYDGEGTGGTQLYTGAVGSQSSGWQLIELTSSIPITAGNSYTFELVSSSSSFAIRLYSFDPYPGESFIGSGNDVRFRTYKLDCDTGYIISPVSANGTVNVSNVDTIFFSDGTYQVSADTADLDWTVNDTNMYAAVSGNVGIGTSAPADKLHLVGGMRLDGGRIDVRNTGGSIIIGEKAGLVDDFTSNRNVFIGFESGETNTSGTENTAMGAYSLSNNTTGNYNTGLGKSASAKNTTGDENVAVGKFALFENQTGNNNTAVGANALDWGGSADANNTALGFEAGWDAGGSNNVYLGFRAGKQRAGSHRLFIENSAADKDNALIYGEFDNDLLVFNANVGINTTSPTTKLHVNGTVRIQDGTQGDGKVLTSNANGVASWQTSPAMPVGTIVMYVGEDDNIPDGWLFCGGQSFDGGTYPELQTLLGGTNTPNLKGRFPLGAKPIVNVGETPYPLKGTGGEEEVTLTIDEMPSHTHDVTITFREAEEQGSGNDYSDLNGGSSSSRTYESEARGGGQAHNNMPPFYSVNFIIKAN